MEGLLYNCCPNDFEIDLCDTLIDGMLMEEIHGKEAARLDLMSMADMCDPMGGEANRGVDVVSP